MIAQNGLWILEEDKLAIEFHNGYCPIFSFAGTLWYCSLLLWLLGYKGFLKIHTKTCHWSPWITVGVPITITKGF